MSTSRISRIDSIEELAGFWDDHDLTEFEDELEEVREPVSERRTYEVVTVRLSASVVEALKRLAKMRVTGHADLGREWVRERILES